jgi:hypothetical protein
MTKPVSRKRDRFHPRSSLLPSGRIQVSTELAIGRQLDNQQLPAEVCEMKEEMDERSPVPPQEWV